MTNQTLAAALVAIALTPAFAQAKPVVKNLGGGLAEIASTEGRAKSLSADAKGPRVLAGRAGVAELSHPVVFDKAGRPLVRITLDGRRTTAEVLKDLSAIAGVEVRASNASYRAGVIEAHVPAASLAAIAKSRGIRAVVPSSPMYTDAGAAQTAGRFLHRINKLPAGINGRGITIGAMSDSYDMEGSITTAADDIASGDLPGPGNPGGNATPVTVLQEGDPGDTDEGRAILQILHDVAPKARLGFATANGGEVNFANNIRALGGFADAPNAQAGFKADIIIDDVIYPTEPMFQDGIVAQAVDDVAAAGIAHFSSAGNRSGSESYDSAVRIVPGRAQSWANTNLDFSGVDPALYAGGFHDFDAGSGRDIAQTIQADGGSLIVFQWNEPFDPEPPTVLQVLAEGTGTVPDGGDTVVTFDGTAGQLVEIFVDGDESGPGTANPDVTFALFDPNGNFIQFVDNTTNPESLILVLPATGTYFLQVDSFTEDQFGDFLYRVSEVEVAEQVLSDYNLLFFLEDGTFIGNFAEQNLFSNRPLEAGGLPGITMQLVVSRANTPPKNNRNVADRIRYVGFDGVRPQEHFKYLSPVTYGHNSARGAIGVAAYPFFRPFIPEFFTSPGPSTIYFNRNNRRLNKPDVREKPDLAAMDGGNTTFFFEDALEDEDTLPNFFGTSAAAPHAAAIGALVLQAAGGPGRVKPNRMRRILQKSAFPHDLDPHYASGFGAGGQRCPGVQRRGRPEPAERRGPELLHALERRQAGAQLRAERRRRKPDGPAEGARVRRARGPRPAIRHRHGQGDQSGQRARSPLAAGGPAGRRGPVEAAPAAFPQTASGATTSSPSRPTATKRMRSVRRVRWRASRRTCSAAACLLPSGEILPDGARFFGSFEDGTEFHGRMRNEIGTGYSALDGYGFINAERAVNAVLKD